MLGGFLHLAGGTGQQQGVIRQFLYGAAQLTDHGGEGVTHLSYFICAGDMHSDIQIAIGDLLGLAHQIQQRRHD